MDPISTIDRLALILRQRLAERAKLSTAKRPGANSGQLSAGLQGVQALAAIDDVDEGQFKRALIQRILAEELGGDLINEAKFQQVVTRVTDALNDDASTSRLLSRIATDMRKRAR